MAIPSNPYVYMETVETARDETAKLKETWGSGLGSIPGGEQPQGVLVCVKHWGGKDCPDKRKTDTVRLL